MVQIQWRLKAVKQLHKIDCRYKKNIQDRIDSLVNFPLVSLDIKKLKTGSKLYRVRAGEYRIIFQIKDGLPVICEIQEILRRKSTTY